MHFFFKQLKRKHSSLKNKLQEIVTLTISKKIKLNESMETGLNVSCATDSNEQAWINLVSQPNHATMVAASSTKVRDSRKCVEEEYNEEIKQHTSHI